MGAKAEETGLARWDDVQPPSPDVNCLEGARLLETAMELEGTVLGGGSLKASAQGCTAIHEASDVSSDWEGTWERNRKDHDAVLSVPGAAAS